MTRIACLSERTYVILTLYLRIKKFVDFFNNCGRITTKYHESLRKLTGQNRIWKCDEEKEYCESPFYREQPVGERRKKSGRNTSRSSKPKWGSPKGAIIYWEAAKGSSE